MQTYSKSYLRKKFRDICSRIPAAYRSPAARSAAAIFSNLSVLKQSEHIACYIAFKDEFDAAPLMEVIWQAQKYCYLPVLSEESETLFFTRYEYGDALHVNRFSILEPVNVSRLIAPENLDIVITPLIAFDAHGARLGTGGGYYDRTFAFLHAATGKKTQMVGLGYAVQQADHLPTDPWDIKLNGVVTEKTFISCS